MLVMLLNDAPVAQLLWCSQCCCMHSEALNHKHRDWPGLRRGTMPFQRARRQLQPATAPCPASPTAAAPHTLCCSLTVILAHRHAFRSLGFRMQLRPASAQVHSLDWCPVSGSTVHHVAGGRRPAEQFQNPKPATTPAHDNSDASEPPLRLPCGDWWPAVR